jgi:hypothetical protein
VFLDEAPQFGQLAAQEPLVSRQGDWAEPELGVSLGLRDVDVRRFMPLEAEEEEPIPAHAQHSRHS